MDIIRWFTKEGALILPNHLMSMWSKLPVNEFFKITFYCIFVFLLLSLQSNLFNIVISGLFNQLLVVSNYCYNCCSQFLKCLHNLEYIQLIFHSTLTYLVHGPFLFTWIERTEKFFWAEGQLLPLGRNEDCPYEFDIKEVLVNKGSNWEAGF